jgi:Uma2 family endonuclease
MASLLDQPRPPRVRRWTKSVYWKHVDRGAFEGERVFLHRGEIIEMAPSGFDHGLGTTNSMYQLIGAFPRSRFVVRVQLPFETPGESVPEPDALVCTNDDSRRAPCPNRAVLVVEVADSSLAIDREKSFDYAAAGVPEYWIVDVARRVVEVYRGIVDGGSALLGKSYSIRVVLREGESITPLEAPDGSQISVASLLP